MNLSELKQLLTTFSDRELRMRLPRGAEVPLSFHITEVGRVEKTFIDCGGEMHHAVSCQLQVWVGEDADHRIPASKAVSILGKAASFLPDESVPVEIEYEDEVLSQYTVERVEVNPADLVFILAPKHTDCLAKELCGLPAESKAAETSCCGPSRCC